MNDDDFARASTEIRLTVLGALYQKEKARADQAAARVKELEALLREVACSGVEFEDERVRYVAVQIDRNTWQEIRALGEKKP